jgi:hypothetical protein
MFVRRYKNKQSGSITHPFSSYLTLLIPSKFVISCFNNFKLSKMDLMGMGKLKETQQNGRNKKRLDTVLVDEQSTDVLLKHITANRTIKSVTIADDLLQDKEIRLYDPSDEQSNRESK